MVGLQLVCELAARADQLEKVVWELKKCQAEAARKHSEKLKSKSGDFLCPLFSE